MVKALMQQQPNGSAWRGETDRARSKIHLQYVEPAREAIDRVNDAALVDEDVVELD
jgi:hypothetical protein